MSLIKPLLIPLVAALLVLLLSAMGFVVVPPCDVGDHGWGCEKGASLAKGWIARATNVGTSESGDLQIDLAILNETGDWSAMQALPGRPAVLKTSDGQTSNCDAVFVGTGGHYLAPGFQMRGYISGTETESTTQLISVECKGAAPTAGATLAIDVSYVTGQYNYYDKTANTASAKLEVKLDELATDQTYPVATPVDGLIRKPADKILGLNEVALTLANAQRTADGLEFTWQAFNPSDYPSALHVGPPPVIGADGILYGLYSDPGSVSAPLTSPGKTTEWTTAVKVPPDVKGLYVLVSVETGTRLFTSYVIDVTDK
ncbi:MAG TPA: hypothetical protein VFH29_01265 [Anaerolineales bacterium]|nr:hypothetical protein [Anaerolineales bacterium]